MKAWESTKTDFWSKAYDGRCILKQSKKVNVLEMLWTTSKKAYGKEHNHTVMKSPPCIIFFLLGNRIQYYLRQQHTQLKNNNNNNNNNYIFTISCR